MKDTKDHIKKKQIEIILSKTNEERLEMGLSMMQAGYDLTRERMERENPEASKNKLSYLVFEELYGKEFSKEEKQKVKKHFLNK